MLLGEMPRARLEGLAEDLERRYRAHCDEGLDLDITRGKPSIEQLELSRGLDGILAGDYRLADGTDARGYGGLEGIPEARALAADWLGVRVEEVMVAGNSSLTLMHLVLAGAVFHGMDGAESAWGRLHGGARFLCPVPGYDRHFQLCEDLGLDMIPVPLTGSGPDMDLVERLVAGDPGIKGIWCVPKYSNPSGETYDDDTVRRLAQLPQHAGEHFRVMWDNAYAVHDLGEPVPLANVMDAARAAGTADGVVVFGSTSKVTFAGAGLAFVGASPANIAWLRGRLGVMTIGPDKVNQLRHVRLLQDMDAVRDHMEGHARVLGPKFERVEQRLREGLEGLDIASWSRPRGGYFVSVDALPGLGREIVELAAGAGVKLTPAGAAFPYGRDPEDRNIRLAPSYPPLEEVDAAMRVFVTCVKLASVRKRLREMNA